MPARMGSPKRYRDPALRQARWAPFVTAILRAARDSGYLKKILNPRVWNRLRHPWLCVVPCEATPSEVVIPTRFATSDSRASRSKPKPLQDPCSPNQSF
ncbi:MAG: hypothetical protein ACI835_003360 [Planctomycetota bacterium]|jgi:hypothetical protein